MLDRMLLFRLASDHDLALDVLINVTLVCYRASSTLMENCICQCPCQCVCVFVCSRIILTFTWISQKIFGELNNKIDNVMSHRINVVIDLDKTFFYFYAQDLRRYGNLMLHRNMKNIQNYVIRRSVCAIHNWHQSSDDFRWKRLIEDANKFHHHHRIQIKKLNEKSEIVRRIVKWTSYGILDIQFWLILFFDSRCHNQPWQWWPAPLVFSG